MNPDMMEALAALAEDRGISVDTLFAALAEALEAAYKKQPDAYEFTWVNIDTETGEMRVFAQELDEDGEPVGPEMDVTPEDFGRIAAQTVRQVMTQRIREAEEAEMRGETPRQLDEAQKVLRPAIDTTEPSRRSQVRTIGLVEPAYRATADGLAEPSRG